MTLKAAEAADRGPISPGIAQTFDDDFPPLASAADLVGNALAQLQQIEGLFVHRQATAQTNAVKSSNCSIIRSSAPRC